MGKDFKAKSVGIGNSFALWNLAVSGVLLVWRGGIRAFFSVSTVYPNCYVQCVRIFEGEKYTMNVIFQFVREQSLQTNLEQTPRSTRYGSKK